MPDVHITDVQKKGRTESYRRLQLKCQPCPELSGANSKSNPINFRRVENKSVVSFVPYNEPLTMLDLNSPSKNFTIGADFWNPRLLKWVLITLIGIPILLLGNPFGTVGAGERGILLRSSAGTGSGGTPFVNLRAK